MQSIWTPCPVRFKSSNNISTFLTQSEAVLSLILSTPKNDLKSRTSFLSFIDNKYSDQFQFFPATLLLIILTLVLHLILIFLFLKILLRFLKLLFQAKYLEQMIHSKIFPLHPFLTLNLLLKINFFISIKLNTYTI